MRGGGKERREEEMEEGLSIHLCGCEGRRKKWKRKKRRSELVDRRRERKVEERKSLDNNVLPRSCDEESIPHEGY